ncbi:MAG TPA: hypothetical protein VGH11_02215 [Jatrophihabitans sp.]|jgi:hypothetical protein
MKSHSSRTWVFYVVSLFVAGVLAWWVVTALLGLLFKLVVIALVVGGAVYLFGRSNRQVGGGPRRLGR